MDVLTALMIIGVATVAGETVIRVAKARAGGAPRLQAHLDQPFLPEGRLAADGRELVAQPGDNRPGRTGRRDDAEVHAGERAAIAEFAQRRDIGEQRQTLVTIH